MFALHCCSTLLTVCLLLISSQCACCNQQLIISNIITDHQCPSLRILLQQRYGIVSADQADGWWLFPFLLFIFHPHCLLPVVHINIYRCTCKSVIINNLFRNFSLYTHTHASTQKLCTISTVKGDENPIIGPLTEAFKER